MDADVLVTSLPNELMEYILEDENLTISDVINFALTCKHFYRFMISSNKLWKTKYFQRWPTIKEVYEEECKLGKKVHNWYTEVKASFYSIKELMSLLYGMSAKNYHRRDLSNVQFQEFDRLFRPEEGAPQLAYHILVNELINLIVFPALENNLTHKYYAYKIVRYLRQNYLTDEWYRFINLPPEEQIIEKGAVLVAQWSQPERHVSYQQISASLDNIANQTKELLKTRNPTHSIFSTPSAQFKLWKLNNIDDNQWSIAETKEIMTTLREVMFNRLGFQGNSEMYYSLENSFIDRVLEHRRGIPITLAIVFESVARRLGMRCEPICLPAHFLLRWKENYKTSDPDSVKSFYIDVFNGGKFITKEDCPRVGGTLRCPIEKHNIHKPANAVEVIARMVGNLEVAGRQHAHVDGRAARLRSTLELLHMVRPHDTGAILHLARFYMLHQMDLSKLVTALNHMLTASEITLRGPANQILQLLQDYTRHMNVPEEDIVVKTRTPEVKYAVGLIMMHCRFDYFCVITGWDTECKASPEWIAGMRMDELTYGENQPFYYVFSDDGSSGYAAQENLIMAPSPGWINNEEIGRFFCKFNGTHYVPNEEKQKEYPEDAEIRDKLVRQTYLETGMPPEIV